MLHTFWFAVLLKLSFGKNFNRVTKDVFYVQEGGKFL